MCAMSDLKMRRLLETIDAWARDHDLEGEVEPPHLLPPTRVPDEPALMMNLSNSSKSNIRTIIWATGYRPDYTWLEVPVLDHKGMIRHDGGVTSSPGLYLMGAPFMRRRKSTLIDGAGDDARELSGHLASTIDAREPAMALEHSR
jgi:putative flavoprotein involved in K+ transport